MLKDLSMLAILLLATLTGCLTAAEEKQIDNIYSVDVTSNPDTVKDCRRIASVNLTLYTGHNRHAPGMRQTPLEYLRLQAAEFGANMLFTTNSQFGDAYDCPAKPTEPTPAP